MPWRLVSRFALQGAAVALVASLVALLVWQLTTRQAGASLVEAVENGEAPRAPGLELPPLEGGAPVSLASYRGKGVVLNFWASWCEPCKREAPMLERAWREHRDRGLVVLGVNAHDFERDARGFVERYGLTYPIVHDGPGASLDRYGLTGFPETWWIDRRGRLVAYSRGEFSEEELERNIDRVLGAS